MSQSTPSVKSSPTHQDRSAPRYDPRGGHFLTHPTDPAALFIPEEWSDEQLLVRDTVNDFCRRHVQEPFFERGRELQITREEDRPEIMATFKRAADLGLCSVSIPEEYGGMGLDFNTGTLFSEAIAAGFSFATSIGAQTSIGSLPIVLYGSESQKRRYLPHIADGSYIASYCLTEPQAGSDANALKTSAVLSEDGQHYRLNGQKIWITNGGMAQVFIVFAKIEGDPNSSAFIVERTFEGLRIGPEEKKMGIKASSTVQLYFDNLKVPVENLLGERGAGFKMALNILNTGRIKLAAGSVGGAKLCVSRGVQYALERQQFGKKIAEFGAIQARLAEMAAQTFAIESAVYRTSSNIDKKTQHFAAAGRELTEAKLRAIREFAIECALVKVKGSELACYATDEAMQIHGGMGYAVETGLEMAYRDARITKIYEGTNDINRMLAVGELFKRNFKKEIDLAAAGKSVAAFVAQQFLPFASGEAFAVERRLVRAIKSTFLLLSGAVGKRFKKELIEEQEIVLNLSRILAEAYVAESVLLRVQKLSATSAQPAERYAAQLAALRLYLYDSRDEAARAAHAVIASFAGGWTRWRLDRVVERLLRRPDWNPRDLGREVAAYLYERGEYGF
ncbi:MAG: acyl-CoA dehydrogenase family protein [Bacteroidota bacterium]